MSNSLKLRDIMTKSVLTFPPEMEINRAMSTLLDRHFSGAPVVDDQSILIGVLSQKDCLKAVLNCHYHQEWGGLVRDFMTPDVETLEEDMDLIEVSNRFINSTYRRFPVLKKSRLIGQVSRRDVLLALMREWG